MIPNYNLQNRKASVSSTNFNPRNLFKDNDRDSKYRSLVSNFNRERKPDRQTRK